MSGIRKPPPISTASPLDTITSLFSHNANIVRNTADALLLTTNADSAPVKLHKISLTISCLEPLFADLMLNSKSE